MRFFPETYMTALGICIVTTDRYCWVYFCMARTRRSKLFQKGCSKRRL